MKTIERMFIVVCISILILSPVASGQTGNTLPFTADGIRSIVGRNLCDFSGEFPERFGVYLNGRKDNSLDYRQRDGVSAVFLLSVPTERCGVVDAALDLTSVVRKGESIEFKCYTSREGGTTWAKWGHVIGLADNENGLQRFVKPRLAWRVNVEEKRFEELQGQSVTCDTNGYAD